VSGEDNHERLALLESTVERLRDEVVELNKSTKALVEAWNTATGLLKFVKMLSTFIAAAGVIYFFFTHGFKWPPA
jgi:hypothetical protein